MSEVRTRAVAAKPQLSGRSAPSERKPGTGLGKRVDDYYEPVRRLGLESYIPGLETYGYTVIPPELVSTPAFIERVRAALLLVAEARTGVPHSLERNGDGGKYVRKRADFHMSQYALYYLLFEDPVFEEWLENPVLAALVNYALRGSAHLSSMVTHVKWRGDGYGPTLGLHSDCPSSPEGSLPANFEMVCNCALVVTEYTRENGALAIVPGSHKLFRQPRPGEGVDDAIPVEAPVGSLIFWRGGTWHGAYPKDTDGLRLNITTYFTHRMLKTLEQYQRAVPKEMLDRHSRQFALFVGADDPSGWGAMGAEPTYLEPSSFG